MAVASAVARRSFADARVRTGSFAALFVFVAAANVVGYRRSYPTIAERLNFARSFGANKAVELFYGSPHDLLSVGGYAAWRVGGVGAIIAGVFGLLGAVRALRAEEDAGRQELVLAGSISRSSAYLGALAAIAAGSRRPVARTVRELRVDRPPARRLGVPRARDRVARRRLRRSRSARLPAGADASDRPRARDGDARARVSPAGGRRHSRRRPAGSAGRRRSVGAKRPVRSPARVRPCSRCPCWPARCCSPAPA